jgi:hypothetical protein
MIEDPAKEFLMVSSGEGGSGLSSPRRRSMGASFSLVTTTPRMENAPTTQAMMTFPPQTVAPRPDTGLLFEQGRAHHEGQRVQARTRQPSAEQEATQR